MRDAPRYLVWPPIALAAPLVAGVLLSSWRPLDVDFPGRVVLALVLSLVFVAVNATAYRAMWRARTGVLPGQPATRILTAWPFSWSRNPLYVGLLALYAALALLARAGWALVLLPVAFLALHFGAVRPEERYLESKFGEDYLAYKRRVRRWV